MSRSVDFSEKSAMSSESIIGSIRCYFGAGGSLSVEPLLEEGGSLSVEPLLRRGGALSVEPLL